MPVIVAILAAGVRLTTPILLASLGELVTERSGTLNLGLEGVMMFGALAGFVASSLGHTPWIGCPGGAGCGRVGSLADRCPVRDHGRQPGHRGGDIQHPGARADRLSVSHDLWHQDRPGIATVSRVRSLADSLSSSRVIPPSVIGEPYVRDRKSGMPSRSKARPTLKGSSDGNIV
jgi:hypothetical protein